MQHDGGRLAFQETTDRIIQALGIRTGKQRLDSTHIMSNIATLTRLGLFCETIRLVPAGLALGAPRASPWGSGGPASSPSEKHGWRVFGGMMGPVQ